jgi:vacuolar iron transporter family protein
MLHYTEPVPHEHDHHHHEEPHFHHSNLVRDVVIGMADGLTVPFALAAGLTGAVASSSLVLTAGIAEIVAGSIAMGLGGYLAGQTEVQHYASELKREYDEVERVPEREKQEIMEVLEAYGISEPLQKAVTEELAKDKDKWVSFMMRFELGLEEPNPKQATKSALTIGLSYVAGGLIPLMPYAFFEDSHIALQYSAVSTLICLFVFGWYKNKALGQSPLKGALNVALIGSIAASAAYVVAKLLGG